MTDQSYELMQAMLNAAKADIAVTALVPAASIYADDAPPDATPPYIVFGDSDARRADVTCLASQGIFVTVHVWSWGALEASGTVQARKISAALSSALHDAALVLDGGRLITVEHRRTRVFKDADGVKNHGVIEFWASVEAA